MITGALARVQVVPLLLPLVAVTLAIATSAILLRLAGADPGQALGDMWSAALGSGYAVSTSVVKALPRLLAGLAVAFALRAGLWNIGAEGQIYVGAVCAAGVALFGPALGGMSPPLILLMSALGGALWAALPAFLRAYRGISEVITTLMLVYVAIQLASYLITGPWGIAGASFPATEPVPETARLPLLGTGTALNAGVLIGLAVAVVVWLLLDRTTLGVRLRAIGGNASASSAMGLNVPRVVVVALCLSGALAGLAGGLEVLGSRGRLVEGFSPGYGFEGIAVALLGRLRVGGIVAAALLFGALDAGGAGLQASGSGMSSTLVQVTAGLAVIYLLAALGLREIHARRSKARAALDAAEAHPEPTTSEVSR